MNTLRSKKIYKSIVDITMLLCLIGCINSTSVFEKSNGKIDSVVSFESTFHWGTAHCIIGVIFVGFIILHIWQHWSFFKVLIRKRLYLKNKIATLASLAFVLLTISLLLFLINISAKTLNFHSVFMHVFIIIAIIHIIAKTKQFIALFNFRNGNK